MDYYPTMAGVVKELKQLYYQLSDGNPATPEFKLDCPSCQLNKLDTAIRELEELL